MHRITVQASDGFSTTAENLKMFNKMTLKISNIWKILKEKKCNLTTENNITNT